MILYEEIKFNSDKLFGRSPQMGRAIRYNLFLFLHISPFGGQGDGSKKRISTSIPNATLTKL